MSAAQRPICPTDVPPPGTQTEFARYLAMLESSCRPLACKPDESPAAALRALWLAAAGEPCSVQRAVERPLPRLSADERETRSGSWTAQGGCARSWPGPAIRLDRVATAGTFCALDHTGGRHAEARAARPRPGEPRSTRPL
jgi:hypothetical protein